MESKKVYCIETSEKISITIDGEFIGKINNVIEYLIEQYGGPEKFFLFAKEVIDNGKAPEPGLETHISIISSIIAMYEKSAYDSKKIKIREFDNEGNLGEIKDVQYDDDGKIV